MDLRTPQFQRKIENFKCEHCGQEVEGNGYTNHCPYCLWSKHVDNNPGDRANQCEGMMMPIDYEVKRSGNYFIIHKCLRCGAIKRNKVSPKDHLEMLMKIKEL